MSAACSVPGMSTVLDLWSHHLSFLIYFIFASLTVFLIYSLPCFTIQFYVCAPCWWHPQRTSYSVTCSVSYHISVQTVHCDVAHLDIVCRFALESLSSFLSLLDSSLFQATCAYFLTGYEPHASVANLQNTQSQFYLERTQHSFPFFQRCP